ncbi:MAG: DNA/RNA nuclease SfsA [Nitrospiraceae bacterium]|nr:MAG: DNA/RNA nuclease SfsA [Nitrospiraceae bacterium]
MKLFTTAEKAVFRTRPNRFVITCLLNGKPVMAYLPNPGRLWELLLPGVTVLLVRQPGTSARMRYIAVAVEKKGVPIFLHTHLNNAVARYLIENNRVPGLEGAAVVRPEVTAGKSRFDFLLLHGGREVLLEVKSCTLFSGTIGMFPDAETLRGRKHLLELASQSGMSRRGAVLVLVHSPGVRFFLPEYHTDLGFARALLSVSDRIMVRALSVGWNRDLSLAKNTKNLFIPWGLIRDEAQDRGSYIIVLHLRRTRRITAGSLGAVLFRQGYYLYVGSAQKNLSKRIARHQRKRKNHFWHIDHLREAADFVAALPVRSGDDLECRIAASLQKISGWHIPRFGSSDCVCASHLCAMTDNPLRSPSFIDMLMYFRIDRLAERAAACCSAHEGP